MSAKFQYSEQVMREIIAVTARIHEKFPDLYDHLDETPLFHYHNEEEISIDDFKQYLEAITMQLSEFTAAHPSNTN